MSASGVRGSSLTTPLATSFTFIPIRGISGGRRVLLALRLLTLEFVTLAFLDVAFVLIVTTLATVTTGDGTPEVVLMGHSFPIFSMLLTFHLQHTATAEIAVRGMTRSPLAIDRSAVKQGGGACISWNLVHGT